MPPTTTISTFDSQHKAHLDINEACMHNHSAKRLTKHGDVMGALACYQKKNDKIISAMKLAPRLFHVELDGYDLLSFTYESQRQTYFNRVRLHIPLNELNMEDQSFVQNTIQDL